MTSRNEVTSVERSAATSSEKLGPSQLRILLVEDHADTAMSEALLLQTMGHDVHVAKNGLMALEMIQERMPDVVLLDIGLPGILDGWKVAEIIRAQASERRPFIIAITGRGLAKDVNHSLEA